MYLQIKMPSRTVATFHLRKEKEKIKHFVVIYYKCETAKCFFYISYNFLKKN